MMVTGRGRARFEIDFGHAHSISHEKNFAAAARESFFTAFFRPMGRSLPQFFVLHQLNRHITKGLVREVPCDVRKVSRRKPGAAVLEVNLHRRLALDFVRDVSIAKCNANIVVSMAVHQRRSMGRDFDLEGADVFIVNGEVVRRLRGDLDLSRCLRRQEGYQQEKKQHAFHGREL